VADALRRPIHFIASSLKDLRAVPTDVRGAFGRQLLDAQYGDTPAAARPLKGFGDASVVELIEDEGSSTYRAVYTVRFAEAVYVLHVFQKKSTKGIATPKADVDLVKRRLKAAEGHYQQHYRRIGHTKEDGHA
jgi:phage-related protein